MGEEPMELIRMVYEEFITPPRSMWYLEDELIGMGKNWSEKIISLSRSQAVRRATNDDDDRDGRDDVNNKDDNNENDDGEDSEDSEGDKSEDGDGSCWSKSE
ncbi:hypothetical protein CAEBREN_24724 [Caenorhabditis brenneri]|uniref:Uncharacterized protein n=1 Tax=Caenorhabditis brenneri TaxID=135651 RepID=G0PL68_CAEBE|nr:hypothetical protein CAEBREN_24724 [Caenorhabditis brenneri]